MTIYLKFNCYLQKKVEEALISWIHAEMIVFNKNVENKKFAVWAEIMTGATVNLSIWKKILSKSYRINKIIIWNLLKIKINDNKNNNWDVIFREKILNIFFIKKNIFILSI